MDPAATIAVFIALEMARLFLVITTGRGMDARVHITAALAAGIDGRVTVYIVAAWCAAEVAAFVRQLQ